MAVGSALVAQETRPLRRESFQSFLLSPLIVPAEQLQVRDLPLVGGVPHFHRFAGTGRPLRPSNRPVPRLRPLAGHWLRALGAERGPGSAGLVSDFLAVVVVVQDALNALLLETALSLQTMDL